MKYRVPVIIEGYVEVEADTPYMAEYYAEGKGLRDVVETYFGIGYAQEQLQKLDTSEKE